MPELPEVERVRRVLEPSMAGSRFLRVRLNRPDLRRPFPRGFARRLQGQTVSRVTRRGKYLLVELASGDILLTHLGMSGSLRAEPTTRRRARPDAAALRPDRHDHVVFEMSSGLTVTFDDPRRFGVMDLLRHGVSAHQRAIDRLGPEPLSPQFDAEALARACANRRAALKIVLLDQRVVAGVGNIYASEALHLARLSPLRRAATIATAAGAARPAAPRLAAAIKATLRRAVARQTAATYRAARFRVYDRAGEPCVTPGCKGTIERLRQAGRSTFYCPVCQR